MPLDQYDPVFQAAGREWNVDPTLLKAMATQESGGNPRAVSRKGASGVMQIMPDTGRGLGVTNPADPEQSIFGGAKYMRQLLDKYGSPEKALAAYNAGPGRVDQVQAGQASLPDETAAYVPAVTAHYQRLSSVSGGNAGAAAGPQGDGPAFETNARVDSVMARLRGGQGGATAPDDPASESDADFLKRTAGGGQAAPATEDDAAFLARTGGVIKPAAPEVPSSQAAPAGGEYGLTGEPGEFDKPGVTIPIPAPVANVLSAASRGAQAGMSGDNPLMTPKLQMLLQNSGALGQAAVPALNAAGTVLKLPGAVMNALQAGVAQTGAELGAPQLGRDLAAFPEAFPTGDAMGGTRIPMAPEQVMRVRPEAPTAPRGVVTAITPAALAAEIETARNPLAPQTIRPEQPSAPAPVEAATPAFVSNAGPGAAGADITTAPIPEKTRAQALRDLQSSVTQSAEDRAGPGMKDTTAYVPGVVRSRAAQEFTPANALDEKMMRASDPAFRADMERNDRNNNETMVDHLRQDAGDPISLEQLHENREAVAPPAQQLFEGQKAVDAQPFVSWIDQQLAGPAGKRGAVSRTLADVRSSLYDANGELETQPSQLYGARQNITDLLKKGAKGTGDIAGDAKLSKSILGDALEQIDPIINDGAPKYQAYLRDFADASRPIDQQEVLQSYQTGTKKVTDQSGRLLLNKVQKMLDDVYQGQSAPGINKYKSLTDDQVGRIIAVRNELAANALRDRLASVKGADTFQQINRSGVLGEGPLGTAVKGLSDLAVHGALAHTTGGAGNLLYQFGYKPAMAARTARKQANALAARKSQLLQSLPDENARPNPLNPR